MENLKNLCGQIPEALHKRVLEDKGLMSPTATI